MQYFISYLTEIAYFQDNCIFRENQPVFSGLRIDSLLSKLCIAFFPACFCGTGTDDKNLKRYSSYPDEVQNRIKSITEYQGKFRESTKAAVFISGKAYRMCKPIILTE